MSESTAGGEMSDSTLGGSRCEGQMCDGRACMVPAGARFRESDGSAPSLCLHHARRWRAEYEQFKRALGIETLSSDYD